MDERLRLLDTRSIGYTNKRYSDAVDDVESVDIEQSESWNGQESSASLANRNSIEGTTNIDRDQKGNLTELSIESVEIQSFLKRTNPNKALCCRCGANESEDIVLETNSFGKISSVKCNRCGETTKVDPWWMFDEDKDVKEDIFRFLRYHNATKTFCSIEKCKENDEVNFVPAKQDRFGVVSSVGCIRCRVEMSLKMNVANSHILTIIETVEDVKPGDEIMFRRCYGISHHAIYIKKSDNEGNNQSTREVPLDCYNGCCNRCKKCFQSSEVAIDVISHTFDEEDARVIKSKESLGGVDIYRVEYESCYPPRWTEWNAKRAEKFSESCKKVKEAQNQDSKSHEALESNYDPLMENCEHFARRCKTGQSESRQAKSCLYKCRMCIAILIMRLLIVAAFLFTTAGGNLREISGPLITVQYVTLWLSIFLSTAIVVYSSVQECRNIRRRKVDKKNPNRNKQPALGRYGRSCSTCCCKCCPKMCYPGRYFFRLILCEVPFRLCKLHVAYICAHSTMRSCEFKCKPCCDDPIPKFWCRQCVVVIVRVIVEEVIVIGVPVALFVVLNIYAYDTLDSSTRVALGVLFSVALFFILSIVQFCIANMLSRAIGWCCLHLCCCCYCCCSFKSQMCVDLT